MRNRERAEKGRHAGFSLRLPEWHVYVRDGGRLRYHTISGRRWIPLIALALILAALSLSGPLTVLGRWAVVASQEAVLHARLALTEMELARAQSYEKAAEEARLRADAAEQALRDKDRQIAELNDRLQEAHTEADDRLRTALAAKEVELAGLRATYRAAFDQLNQYRSVLDEVAAEVDRVETSLAAIADRAAPPARSVFNERYACSSRARRVKDPVLAATGPLPGVDAGATGELRAALDRLRASHTRFLHYYDDFTRGQIDQLQTALRTLGLADEPLLRPVSAAFGSGGPAAGRVADGDWGNAYELLTTTMSRWERLSRLADALPLGSPLRSYQITSHFGRRADPISGKPAYHEGIDLGAPRRTPVMATGSGTVTFAGRKPGYGRLVEIDHGSGVRTVYGHLDCVAVEAGAKVERGRVIGLVGNTGRSTGPHLHYEVIMKRWPQNPVKFIMAGENVFQAK